MSVEDQIATIDKELDKELDARKLCWVHPSSNYGCPHICGYVRMGDTFTIAKNCVFCGKDCEEDFVGSIYEYGYHRE